MADSRKHATDQEHTMKAIVHDSNGSSDVLELSDIDRAYPFSRVSEAIQHWETGHAKEKVVITV